MDLCALCQSAVRGQWEKIPGQNYQSKTVVVELNLNDPEDEAPRWINVRLLFVRGVPASDKAQPGKHDWCVFLSTDTKLDPQKMLELYAMRWAIEVYFKESKQLLGFLQEQVRHYACYVASIHLTAIRSCLLVIAKQQQGASSVAQMRQQIVGNATKIDFAANLWGCCFRSLMVDALQELKPVLGDKVDLVMQAININVQRFYASPSTCHPPIALGSCMNKGFELDFSVKTNPETLVCFTHDIGFPGFEDILNFCLKSGAHLRCMVSMCRFICSHQLRHKLPFSHSSSS